MCFSPQRRAIFRHQNFKKCSENEVFCTFSLEDVIFPTAACNFSTSELQKVLRRWRVFNILTCECAFRHSGVQFFGIRTSKSAPKLMCFVHFHLKMCFSPKRSLLSTYLRTRRFTGLLFDWPDTKIIEKTQHFATSLTYGADVAIASSFCWLDYPTLLFNCPYCRKLDF